jgi:hypothetical protein
VRIEESGRPVPMTGEQAAPLLARQERISGDLSDPAALERAWAETARRWWRINIEWLASAAREKGPEYAARHFLQEFFYDENNPWVRRMIGEVLRGMPRKAWEQPHGRGQGIGYRVQGIGERQAAAGARDAGRGSNGNGSGNGKVHRRAAEDAESSRETRNNGHKDTAQAEAWTPNTGNGDNGQVSRRTGRRRLAEGPADAGDASAQAAGE